MSAKSKQSLSKIKWILKQYPSGRGSLIPILQDVQAEFGYLSEEAVLQLGRLTGISANEIYAVATFYTQFRFSPAGEHTVCVCEGTACHVRGGRQVLNEVELHLGIKPGQRTEDGKFDLERVACLGCCALAPVVSVNGKVHAEMNARKVISVLSQYGGKKK